MITFSKSQRALENQFLRASKNKDNSLYYSGRGITSVRNVYNYWNYAHSHSTANIPEFNKMYSLV